MILITKPKQESKNSLWSKPICNNQNILVVLSTLLVLLAMLNIYTASHCLFSSSLGASSGRSLHDNGDSHLNQLAIKHRLQRLEEENLENALLLEAFVKKLDHMFHILGPNTIATLHEKAHSTAATLAFEDIMEEIAPPIPNYLASVLEMNQPEMNDLFKEAYTKAYNNAVETRFILEERESKEQSYIKENIGQLEQEDQEEKVLDDDLSKESERILKRMHEIEENYWKQKEESRNEKEGGDKQDEDDLESLKEEIEIENEEIKLCEKFVEKYKVNLQEDLGTMPAQHINEWRTHDCDYILMKREAISGEPS